jgi:hypothetical protein
MHAQEGDSISPDAFRDERRRMQGDIQAAEKSLAATERQLSLDATLLRMALDLAGDVAKVYREASPARRRGYNQAFFKKLKILPEWDEAAGTTRVRVVDAELTEPFAAALSAQLVERLNADAERIVSLSSETETGPEGPISASNDFELRSYGGEGGIRTLERACAPYSLSRRVPSATRPPLRGQKP